MAIVLSKDQKITVSISTLIAIFGGVATAYVTAKQALAGELQSQIKQEIRPLSDALEISTQSSIRQLRTAISALNFKKDMCSGVQACWTISDQRDLDNTVADLAAAEAVLRSLREGK